ncbi:hypothetical protein AMTRI_Chr02g258680 [Amborella trichopoda]
MCITDRRLSLFPLTSCRWRCLSPIAGVSPMLRVYCRRRCVMPSVGLFCALYAYHKRRHLILLAKGRCCLSIRVAFSWPTPSAVLCSPFHYEQKCPAPSRGHDTTFLLLRLASSLRSLLFSFLLPFLLD